MAVNSALVEIETRVSEILFYVWDPIGVNGMPACRNEYEDYVPIVSAYLIHNFSEIGVGALLKYIMEVQIGVHISNSPRRKAQHKETVRMLMECEKDFLNLLPSKNIHPQKFPHDASFEDQIDWSIGQRLNPTTE